MSIYSFYFDDSLITWLDEKLPYCFLSIDILSGIKVRVHSRQCFMTIIFNMSSPFHLPSWKPDGASESDIYHQTTLARLKSDGNPKLIVVFLGFSWLKGLDTLRILLWSLLKTHVLQFFILIFSTFWLQV